MPVAVEFIFDFASPNAYFAHRALPGILERTGAEVKYTICLLGGIFKATGNQSPMTAFAGVPNKLAYEQLEMQRFIAKHQLTEFKFNPHFPVNTLMLARGALVAEEEGRLADYVETGARAMWEQERKMDDPAVFATTFSEAGLDGETILKRTQDPQIKEKLIANTSRAVERGAFGVPTFFVGEEMFFGKDRLDQVEEAIRAAG